MEAIAVLAPSSARPAVLAPSSARPVALAPSSARPVTSPLAELTAPFPASAAERRILEIFEELTRNELARDEARRDVLRNAIVRNRISLSLLTEYREVINWLPVLDQDVSFSVDTLCSPKKIQHLNSAIQMYHFPEYNSAERLAACIMRERGVNRTATVCTAQSHLYIVHTTFEFEGTIFLTTVHIHASCGQFDETCTIKRCIKCIELGYVTMHRPGCDGAVIYHKV